MELDIRTRLSLNLCQCFRALGLKTCTTTSGHFYLHVNMFRCMHATHEYRGQRTAFRSQFPLFTFTWVMGSNLRSSGLSRKNFYPLRCLWPWDYFFTVVQECCCLTEECGWSGVSSPFCSVCKTFSLVPCYSLNFSALCFKYLIHFNSFNYLGFLRLGFFV